VSFLRRHRGALVAVVVLVGAVAFGYAQTKTTDDSSFDAPPPARTQASTPPAQTGTEPARDLFGHECGTCHTLDDAEVTGGVGPDLDRARPTRARVLAMIQNGSVDGAMPANLLTGREAERVASYVADHAGR
jgi:cytochrome c6